MQLRVLSSMCALVFVLGLSHLISSSSDVSSQKEAATPVQLGVMTEKQKEHSDLHSHTSIREKLQALVEKGTGDIEIVDGTYPPLGIGPLDDDSSKVYPNPYLVGIASDADAIVIGRVVGKSSQITGDGTFIFTDYDIALELVLKQNPQDIEQPNSNIVVTRLGGAIQLKGRTIRGKDLFFEPFKEGGRYLLFLKFIPTTTSYKAFQNGTFRIEDNKVTKMTSGKLWLQIEHELDLPSFAQEVRDTIESLRGGKFDSSFRLY